MTGQGTHFYLFGSTADSAARLPSTVFYRVEGESTAEALCGLFAKEYGGPYRSVDPDKLLTKHDAVGPENDAALLSLQKRASITVAMWGSHPIAGQRAHAVCRLLGNLRCLAVNEDGQPRHILYIPYKTELRESEWNVKSQT